MKRLLASLGFLILATGCDKIIAPPPSGPSTVPDVSTANETASVTGIVTLMTAEGPVAVEGALVELLSNVEPALMSAKARAHGRKADYEVLVSTLTDADGRYGFSGIGLGTYTLRISKDGAFMFNSEAFQLSGDTEIDAELNLEDNGAPSRLRRVRR